MSAATMSSVERAFAMVGQPISKPDGSLIGYGLLKYSERNAFDTVVADATLRTAASHEWQLTYRDTIVVAGKQWLIAEQPRAIGNGQRIELALALEGEHVPTP